MSLYTPTVWVENETPRSAALFNKREQGIANLFKKRAYCHSGTGYSIVGDNNLNYLKFGTAGAGMLYDTDNTAYSTCILSADGTDYKVKKPSWATYGIVNATIIPSSWNFTIFYVQSSFTDYIWEAYPSVKKTIKMRGVITANDVWVTIAAIKTGGGSVGYSAFISVVWY